MSRALFVVLAGTLGCISQVQNAMNPSPATSSGGGTLTCAQIVETCDSTCTQPLCLHGCTSNGTPEAQQQHDALLSCGEQHGCTDEACIRSSCPTEVDACQPAAPDPAPSTT
ncbi:MAG: hypothetical protein ABI678_23920 [Kofleriaceae bacterium]